MGESWFTLSRAGIVEAAREALLRHELLPEHVDSAFVSGSLVVGWGHPNSDLDVYVVSDDPPPVPIMSTYRVPVEPETIGTIVRYVDEGRVDVEYWRPAQIDQIVRKVGDYDFEGDVPTTEVLESEEIDILSRLAAAAPIEGEDWLAARQAELEASAVRTIVTLVLFQGADDALDDADGLLKSHDLPAAVLSARRAFGLTVDGLTASYGELAQGERWRARKLLRTKPAELSWDEYWEIETMRGFDEDEAARWVQDVASRCRSLMGSVDLG